MKIKIHIHKEKKYFVAVDLITNLANQGLTEEEALANLKKRLEEHYQILEELSSQPVIVFTSSQTEGSSPTPPSPFSHSP